VVGVQDLRNAAHRPARVILAPDGLAQASEVCSAEGGSKARK
jgi:hypothetical protein